jgi:hypothetical protein
MSTKLLFSTARRGDGLTYVDLLPAHHAFYRLHEFVAKVGRIISRLFVRSAQP